MMRTGVRYLLAVVAALGLPFLASCMEEAAAPKQDRETDNRYTRLERVRVASGQVRRDAKGDRIDPRLAQTANPPGGMPRSGPPSIQTAAIVSAPRLFALPRRSQTKLVSFRNAPFPYDGMIGDSGTPFYNVVENGKRGHRTAFNRTYWEQETYSDPRVLLHVPRHFDANQPGVIVLFFHGHGAMLERDVIHRQQVPKQITASGVNAVLVAPQLAVDARDSSIGKFWERGGIRRFLAEAAGNLAELYGDPKAKAAFEKLPVVVVAYSGGFVPAAWTIAQGGVGTRLQGVVLLDALYGHDATFRNWIAGRHSGFFVSAYANSTRRRNESFEKLLSEANIPVRRLLGDRLAPDSVVFLPTDAETSHRDFVTKAWADLPIKDVLQRVSLGEPDQY
jgi:hypothetical protein